MVIVCEGKNDKNKLENIFKDALIIITNGSEISMDTINTIKELRKTNEVVLCLDPDGPGEKIRKKILEYVPTCANVFAIRNKAISKNKKKVGIEHMTKEDIVELFDDIKISNFKGNIEAKDLYNLGLMESKTKRIELCDKLHIGYCNGKQLLKRLNMLGISIDEVKKEL